MPSLRYLCNYIFWTSPCVRRAFYWCLFGAWKWVFADLYRKKVIEDAGATWLNMLLISGFVRYNYIIYLYLFVAFVQISVPKSFESCDGFFVVFCSPYFTASPWQESLWRTTDIGNWPLIQLWLKRISSKTGRLLWFQANIICEPYTLAQVISHFHLTSLATWHKI